ncbi:hypothetical protein [Rubrobacter aplysinae]|uniref:hypothetical protein n=1 Tax=Rubrobacter aplysinae TaxID=909625 RepID=UPI00128E7186|nr:hypothetical protein [Rubrobacter aplysinae]
MTILLPLAAAVFVLLSGLLSGLLSAIFAGLILPVTGVRGGGGRCGGTRRPFQGRVSPGV